MNHTQLPEKYERLYEFISELTSNNSDLTLTSNKLDTIRLDENDFSQLWKNLKFEICGYYTFDNHYEAEIELCSSEDLGIIKASGFVLIDTLNSTIDREIYIKDEETNAKVRILQK